MRRFTWVSGRLTEVQRFINVPMRWCEQYPARERRELWMTTGEGAEIKLVVHTRVMPARSGHEVVAVLLGEQLVGLYNLSTDETVNFARKDPPLLCRRCDGLKAILLIAASAVAGCAGWPAAGILSGLAMVLCVPLVVLRRWVARMSLVRAIDRAIDSAKQQATGRPGLRRIK
jgi:hypothetical protein